LSFTIKFRYVAELCSLPRDSNEHRQTSVNLLDSLESFLSTFQKDLDAVAGQISELQDRSKDIEGRLKSRRVSARYGL